MTDIGTGSDPRIDFIQFDRQTEKTLSGLHQDVSAVAREHLIRMSEEDLGVDVKLFEGFRTTARQGELLAGGSTQLKVGYHNIGAAYDIQLFEPNGGFIRSGSDIAYQQAGRIGMNLGLTWGGSWKTFVDAGHFQLDRGISIGTMWRRFQTGQDIYTGD
jgi:hypothetical protein